MNPTCTLTARLPRTTLRGLLVGLEDIEREIGPVSPTARLIARIVRERLSGGAGPATVKRMGVPHVA